MAAMFSGKYAEARSRVVPIHGVSSDTFLSFLEYLYTDSCCPGELTAPSTNRLTSVTPAEQPNQFKETNAVNMPFLIFIFLLLNNWSLWQFSDGIRLIAARNLQSGGPNRHMARVPGKGRPRRNDSGTTNPEEESSLSSARKIQMTSATSHLCERDVLPAWVSGGLRRTSPK